MDVKLTQQGKKTVEQYIKECKAKQKEILDAGKDTLEKDCIPFIEDIISDISAFMDSNGNYYNSWAVTDRYSTDYTLTLKQGTDFIDLDSVKSKLYDTYQMQWMLSHGYCLTDLFQVLLDVANEFEFDEEKQCDSFVDDVIDEFENSRGFGGQIYVCYNEFLGSEYLDEEYVKALFSFGKFSQEEIDAYFEDIRPAKEYFVAEFLDTVLKDDRSECGGVSHFGETLREFLEDIQVFGITEAEWKTVPLTIVNKSLRQCGILPINAAA